MKPAFDQVAGDTIAKFLTMEIGRIDPAIEQALRRILAGQSRYESVANKLPNPPWFVIAILHQLESDGDFGTHLHNGDPLSARTVNEPAGRPRVGEPPFTWEESAWDAIRYDRLDQWSDWSIPGIAYQLEGFNGWGYRAHHVASPYLWAGCQHYSRGKFTSDGHFDYNAVSQQVGGMVLLRELCRRGHVALRASRA